MKIGLLEKTVAHSPGPLLWEALEGENHVVLQLTRPEELARLSSERALVVWNLSGFTAEEGRQYSDLLNELGWDVFLLCPRLDQTAGRLIDELDSLIGLSVAPRSVEDIRAPLQVAMKVHRQLGRLQAAWQAERQDLQNRLKIEKAKRKLMNERGWPEAKATKYLQERSRNSNRKLHQVAQEVLAGKDDQGGGGGR